MADTIVKQAAELKPSRLLAGTEYLGRIQSESDDGVIYVDTGFGSQMTICRLDAKFLKALKRTPEGARAAGIIYSYLYLILECDPSIPGCDADERERRIEGLFKALNTKRKRKARPANTDNQGGGS